MKTSNPSLNLMTITNEQLKTQAYINGKWVDAANGATFSVNNPATGEELASVADLSREDVRVAIEAAQAAS